MALNQPISVYLPTALKARVPEAMKYYGATSPSKFFKALLEEAIENMEAKQAQEDVNAGVRTAEQG
jgi:metal-responsive CopG/Arc/MetJ family transcriptional regulator